MASGRSSERSRVRHSMVVNFDSRAAKIAFKGRLEHVHSLLTPQGQPNLDNNWLIAAMFDLVEKFTPFSAGSERASSIQSFNRSSGKSISSKYLGSGSGCLVVGSGNSWARFQLFSMQLCTRPVSALVCFQVCM